MSIRLLALAIPLLALSSPARPAGAAAGTVIVVPIDGEISKGLVYLVRRGIREAEKEKAKALIIEMNTNGGRLDATEEIMQELSHTPVRTITFVDRKAFSAGAFIAVATSRIYMTPGGLIGAATPVMIGPGGAKELSKSFEEKITSATRAMVRAAAKKNGHPFAIVEAMVDRDVEIPGLSEKGKLLTLTSEEAAEEGVGLSAGTVSTIGEILEKQGLAGARVVRLDPLWSESLALLLTNSVVSGLLLMLGMLGLYIEFKTPGFGLPGILGLAALAVFFWGHRVAGLAGSEEIILLLLGFLLLAVEIFIIPGFGVVGVGGIVCVFLAIFLSMIKRFPGGPILPDAGQLVEPLVSMAIAIVGSFTGAVLLIRYLPRTGALHGIILTAEESRTGGYSSTRRSLDGFIGRTGLAVTDLRPAGKARFGEDLIDVVTEGDYLDSGSAIVVLKVEGGRVVVSDAKGVGE